MKTIILSKQYPKGIDLRQQIRNLTEQVRNIVENNDIHLEIDVNNACMSRSAMDEFYKSFMAPTSKIHKKVSVINKDEDFELKLKAVIKSQGIKKNIRHFKKNQIFVLKNADDVKRFVSTT